MATATIPAPVRRKVNLERRAAWRARRILRALSLGKGQYEKADELLAALTALITKKCKKCDGKGYIRKVDSIVIDGKTYVLADNFEQSNRAFRAHGIGRLELKELKPTRARTTD